LIQIGLKDQGYTYNKKQV